VTGSALLTVGHGRLDRSALGALLTAAGVGRVVDVRRFPGSRSNPDMSREALAGWLPGAGIGYRWEERLGGRRRLPPGEATEDGWWQVPAFQAYAAHARTAEFGAALDSLVREASARPVAVMCSESLWWRCHRRLVADVAMLSHGVQVAHLMHDGRLVEHRPAQGARVRSDGLVVWDGP
jgi:uncharacterized protein (DUF488 family)